MNLPFFFFFFGKDESFREKSPTHRDRINSEATENKKFR